MIASKNTHEDNEHICGVRVVHMEKVIQARSQAISSKELERMAGIYKMMGDPTRLKILLALMNNEMCVCDLAALNGLTESAMSHQLRRLNDQNLVKKRRDGQIIYYSLNDEHIHQLVNIGLEHARE